MSLTRLSFLNFFGIVFFPVFSFPSQVPSIDVHLRHHLRHHFWHHHPPPSSPRSGLHHALLEPHRGALVVERGLPNFGRRHLRRVSWSTVSTKECPNTGHCCVLFVVCTMFLYTVFLLCVLYLPLLATTTTRMCLCFQHDGQCKTPPPHNSNGCSGASPAETVFERH
jgi:hypothetical protein